MEILNLLNNKDGVFTDISDLMKGMGKQFPSYFDISFFKLGDQGVSLEERAKA